ncbi:PucR family transcriptional regulator [[Mycobacterium] crassicus]|uniref:PucR family transcriptional regulator n=1 Tax=[Mycobacterium] crassicus TaxID=2872309 RepID=A0ABU5XP81_9MYCO|nr:PucR family transcriptional regulator [Mycolicibacter sp. MYC098]MEB3022871.1 PucR family transcriptional regulator [Mycolicibacter sp. MYC098]
MSWELPSARVRELMRQGATEIVNDPQRWVDELNEATLASLYLRPHSGDPALIESIRQSNLSNLTYWARANVDHPGEPVPVNPQADLVPLLRNAVHRGMDEKAIVEASRIGQNVAWQTWMRTAMELTSDPTELRELLDASTRSITAFTDATVAEACRQVQIEQNALAREKQAERTRIVADILDDKPIQRQHAESRLGYRLEQSHTAAVLWSDETTVGPADISRATEAVLHTLPRHRSLSVPADDTTRWLWFAGTAGPDLTVISTVLAALPAVQVAVGPTAAGIDGFRRSHRDAITTRQMMNQFGSARRVATFADVELIALITSDAERADRFINQTLGEFKSADAELQLTVLTFIHEQCNASRTASRLFTHRNTLSRRLTRANELLPQPLEASSVRVAVALEALRWRAGAH